MRFDQQVALVTGAASGIGRALVQRLVAEGAAVVAVDIVEAPLQTLVTDLREQGATIRLYRQCGLRYGCGIHAGHRDVDLWAARYPLQ